METETNIRSAIVRNHPPKHITNRTVHKENLSTGIDSDSQENLKISSDPATTPDGKRL
jgi:hypothetical protein